MRVDGVDLRLRYADVVAVHREGGELDWEVVAYGLDTSQKLEPGPYRVDADVLNGSTVGGDAILVRSVDGVQVFRGVGDLDGLSRPVDD